MPWTIHVWTMSIFQDANLEDHSKAQNGPKYGGVTSDGCAIIHLCHTFAT